MQDFELSIVGCGDVLTLIVGLRKIANDIEQNANNLNEITGSQYMDCALELTITESNRG